MAKDWRHTPLGGWRLTDQALRAMGVEPSTPVPVLDLPWRPDEKDLRRG